MVNLLKIAGLLVEDAFRWLLLLFRSAEALLAENLLLRRQLALYIERGAQPHRVDAATRISLALLARLFDWRSRWWSRKWVAHYNGGRPHSALGLGVPGPPAGSARTSKAEPRCRWTPGALVRAKSVLGGLHHEYSLWSTPALP
jgi:hypothetical protein